MRQLNAEQGLLVCWGGFRKSVEVEAKTNPFDVRRWDSKALIEAIYRTYEHLPPEIQAQLPLKREWMLVPNDPES